MAVPAAIHEVEVRVKVEVRVVAGVKVQSDGLEGSHRLRSPQAVLAATTTNHHEIPSKILRHQIRQLFPVNRKYVESLLRHRVVLAWHPF
jgi:CTP synthase (UTP-ammonia lyase)